MAETVESEVLNAECMFVSKLNDNNLIKFVADSGASKESVSEVEKVKKNWINKNLQADLEIKMKGVIKTKDSVSYIIKLKNMF